MLSSPLAAFFFFGPHYILFFFFLTRKLKGTKVEVFNCGGTFFKITAKTLEMRLDKLQVYYNECQGDETCHPHYGYPELCKPRVKARKEDAEADRWSWINRCQPDMYVSFLLVCFLLHRTEGTLNP